MRKPHDIIHLVIKESQMAFKSNISTVDRLSRVTVGLYIVIATLFGLPAFLNLLVGFGLILQGILGWCGLPGMINSKLK